MAPVSERLCPFPSLRLRRRTGQPHHPSARMSDAGRGAVQKRVMIPESLHY
ncbi:MAG: hypothetical protein ACE5E6_10625 [Phycisphaerae bacterium]